MILISLAAILLRFSDKWAEIFLGVKPMGGISILSTPTDATVYLDEKEVGKTPYEDKNLGVKDYDVKIIKDSASWQGKVMLTAGTVTVINRDLASDIASSAGEILTLNKGKGLTAISNPTNASVEIDGKFYGNTPTTIDIAPGEHTVLIRHRNYLNRSIRADLPTDFNLTVSADLGLSEADLSAIATPVITQTPEVIVKNTPTGFLRVRDKPSTLGKEVAQVKPGDSLILLEELGAWNRVRLADSTIGYVSAVYVTKKTP